MASEPLQVVVSIRPQLYVVQQLEGELVNVTSMSPEGAFPGIYEPTRKQMQELSHGGYVCPDQSSLRNRLVGKNRGGQS